MKKNFSKGLQTILKHAKEDAIRLGHSYVGSEHLLIGLLKVESGISSKIFELYDIDTESVSFQFLIISFMFCFPSTMKPKVLLRVFYYIFF